MNVPRFAVTVNAGTKGMKGECLAVLILQFKKRSLDFPKGLAIVDLRGLENGSI